ncbi:MAG: hypothetical protein ABI887_16015 [Burkholderiales bacterium]
MDRYQRRFFTARLAALTLLGVLATSAMAAGPVEYHCSGDGVAWTSSRPCPGSRSTELRGFGTPQQPGPSYDTTTTTSLGKAPEYLPYMNIECAQLNDAIRTGPARGLKSGPMADLQADYRKRCSDDEALARGKWQDAQAQERDRRNDQKSAAEAEKSRVVSSAEQCYEMLRILHGKRQRAASMNDGEKADLQRFEDNYKARCPRH